MFSAVFPHIACHYLHSIVFWANRSASLVPVCSAVLFRIRPRFVTSCGVREPRGRSLHVQSGQSPGMSCTLLGVVSLGSRAGSEFSAVASYIVRSFLGSTGQPCVFMGAIIWTEGEGAILWLFGSGLTAASMLGVALSIPTTRSRRRIPWDGVRGCSACRSVCIGRRRLAGFCVAARLWELCRVWLCTT
jgi:hypothetical protein